MTEHQLQAECVQWFWNTYPAWRGMLIHVDNNSYNQIEGNRKKALGVVKGVSDLILIGFHSIYFVELKVGTNVQSDAQKLFERGVGQRGHYYTIIRTTEDFKTLICNIIGKN